MHLVASISAALAMLAFCSIILALTLRVTHWIRARFSQSREIAWCFLTATWSSFGAIVLLLIGFCASSVTSS